MFWDGAVMFWDGAAMFWDGAVMFWDGAVMMIVKCHLMSNTQLNIFNGRTF